MNYRPDNTNLKASEIREIKRTEAAARAAHARSPKDQLAYLDSRGFVAKRERAKLAAKL